MKRTSFQACITVQSTQSNIISNATTEYRQAISQYLIRRGAKHFESKAISNLWNFKISTITHVTNLPALIQKFIEIVLAN